MSETDTTTLPPELATALATHEDALVGVVEEAESVAQLLDLLAFAAEALDDEMVVLLARTADQLGEVADAAADPAVVGGLQAALVAVGEASEEPPTRVGTLGLLRALRDPEVQVGLGFLLAVARALGRELDRRDGPPTTETPPA